jgi:hypothetical protein
LERFNVKQRREKMVQMRTHTGNMDLCGVCNRATKYAEEIIGSATSQVGGAVTQHDANRWSAWFQKLEQYIVDNTGDELDLPRLVNRSAFPLAPFPESEVEKIESQTSRDCVRYLQALWIEASECQSSDWATGIREADSNRLLAVVNKLQRLIDMGEPALDLPVNRHNNPVPNGGNAATASTRARR